MSYPTEADSRLVGRTLGEFVIREKLGEGGGGMVFRAEQPLLAREAVIKVLHAPLQLDENMIQRFMREARLASSLDHPYAAHIYAFGAEPDGLLWIAMELVRGTPLNKLLETHGPLPLTRFVPLFDRLCEVIQTAHDQGIIHRDIKPANVMVLSRAGRLLPKLLDLGIARLREDASEASRPGTIDESGAAEAPIGGPDSENAASRLSSAEGVSSALVSASSVSLTHRGLFVGSPHYMAPEQWVNATEVDRRTDVYALGVLCFEALCGRHPFDGNTPREIAREHAKKAVPSLGTDLPPSLHAVLSRAMAKRASDRFANALEFAAAFRTAAGLAEEPSQLPQIQDSIRELAIADLPQPISEAVTGLEASRTTATALQATSRIFRAIARYLGLMALASRSRIGPGGNADAVLVIDKLRALRHHSLENREWFLLARELCRLFAHQREAHPIPELVSFFFEANSDREAETAALLQELPTNDELQGERTEEQKRELLGAQVSKLTGVIRALSFLVDYPLVVNRAGRTESWMGIRRSNRTSFPIRGKPEADDRPFLLDRDGNLALSLWPLMQTMAPTPGAPEELFMLDGTGRHGAKLVSLPLGFERHDEALWGWFCANIVDVSDQTSLGSNQEVLPYLGLAAFTAEDAKNFFGREREAEAFANRLRVQALLAVVGPSGSGKSSFVQAGVIPLLPKSWHAFVARPGPTPLSTFAGRLAHAGRPLPNLRELLSQNPRALGEHLRAWAQEIGGTVVVVVDQFEELLTLCQSQEERLLFSEALVQAARSEGEQVRVVLTLRDDFLIRAQQLPALKDSLGVGLQLLGTPALEDLMRILTQPARQAGYEFDDPDLPSEMVKSVAEQQGALALLSFTAAKLWELRDRHFRRLTRRAYQSLGGVGGALAQHAETTLGAMSPQEQGLVRESFRHLVTAERTRAVLTRKEISQILGGGQVAESAVERLIQARLLTASEGQGAEDRIEVIHEALLISWPRLVQWQQEDAESARMRHQLRAAARQWEEFGRGRGLLWRKEALMEYRLWRSRYSGRLTDTEEAFAAASLRDEARGRRTRRLLLSGAFLALTIGLVLVTRANVLANRANKVAENRLVMSYEEQGRQLLLSGDPFRGILYLDKAYQGGSSGPAMQYMLGRAIRALNAQKASLPHAAAVLDARFSPDGTRAVTASSDRSAKLWSSADGHLIATLSGHTDFVQTARFSPDGGRIVTSSSDGTARVWDALGGSLLATLDASAPFSAAVSPSAAFAPDGSLIVTAMGKTAKLWDARTFAHLASLEGHTKRIKAFQIEPKSLDVITYGEDGALKRWKKNGELLFSVAAHAPESYQTTFAKPLTLSLDGARLVTGSGDHKVRVWDAATGKPILSVPAAEGFIYSTAVSPDQQSLVTASVEPVAKIWDFKTGEMTRVLQGHTAAIWDVSFSRDGTQVLTASADTTARLWRTAGGGPIMTFAGHVDTLISAELSADENQVITASFDGTAKIWDSRQSPLLFLVSDPEATLLNYLVFAGLSRDGKRVLTVRDDGVIKLWELEGKRLLFKFTAPVQQAIDAAWSANEATVAIIQEANANATVLNCSDGKPLFVLNNGEAVSAIQFSPDGQRLATGLNSSGSRVWDLRDGKTLLSLKGHSDKVSVVAFSADGQRLITGGADKKLHLWDSQTGAELLSIVDFKGTVFAAAFSADGSKFATASRDKRVVIWDTQTGKALVSFQEAKSSNVNSVEFNQAGSLLLTSDVAGAVSVWDAATGRLLSRYFQSPPPMPKAQFSGDGSRAMTQGGREVMVWDTQLDTRTSAEISRYARCRVPFRIEAEKLLQNEIDSRDCAKPETHPAPQ